eukprot:Blabericola_migrator_1__5544@NODE_2824_length_2315_cov_24_279804_g1772_i0_p1_GENE_NODE_2824_length_2315_cov_24_279804_g1772_i0NODE_2824_length_2315_cov_24_279804_g1772_i0_p1_ORF_typecomplete_len374_score70_89Cir_N/PF10197_9/4_8e03Cir_N/PF10197_9/5_5e03Cir_N/PF10197_9/1_3e04Cir_N/PF10197_9/0_037Baculo_PEP_C/PF04513_12/63Baculo_PEP_C/PF04513_12/5_8e02Baculo_PEP_C/PF04513_12/0_73DUF2685/PF10886_8/1_7DUF2685/PF10886_8/1_5e03_NODE_2824_length_2315_cov_24_279804_g1772_i03671488
MRDHQAQLEDLLAETTELQNIKEDCESKLKSLKAEVNEHECLHYAKEQEEGMRNEQMLNEIQRLENAKNLMSERQAFLQWMRSVLCSWEEKSRQEGSMRSRLDSTLEPEISTLETSVRSVENERKKVDEDRESLIERKNLLLKKKAALQLELEKAQKTKSELGAATLTLENQKKDHLHHIELSKAQLHGESTLLDFTRRTVQHRERAKEEGLAHVETAERFFTERLSNLNDRRDSALAHMKRLQYYKDLKQATDSVQHEIDEMSESIEAKQRRLQEFISARLLWATTQQIQTKINSCQLRLEKNVISQGAAVWTKEQQDSDRKRKLEALMAQLQSDRKLRREQLEHEVTCRISQHKQVLEGNGSEAFAPAMTS